MFGLRHAFLVAGAKTLVMSLWPVDDLATCILITRFYENLFRRRLPRDQALRAAKDYVRQLTVGDMRPYWLTDAMRERIAQAKEAYRESFDDLKKRSDTHQPYRDPYYWGAFILVGKTDPIT